MMHEDHSGAADEAQAFATLLVVPTFCFFFAEENEKFSTYAAQVQEDGVEAVQSPPPPPRREASMLRSREQMHARRSEARRWLR